MSKRPWRKPPGGTRARGARCVLRRLSSDVTAASHVNPSCVTLSLPVLVLSILTTGVISNVNGITNADTFYLDSINYHITQGVYTGYGGGSRSRFSASW